MKIRFTIRELLFAISALFVVSSRVWGISVNNKVRSIVAGIWCMYAMLKSLERYRFIMDRKLWQHLKLYLFMYICIFAYTCFLWLFRKDVIFGNFTRLVSTNLYMFFYIGFACAGYMIYKEKIMDMFLYILSSSYFLGSILYVIFRYGPLIFFQYVIQLWNPSGNMQGINYAMEVHELTFAVGVLFLYYAFFEEKSTPNHRNKLMLCILLMYLGYKRIQVLAILVAVLAYWLLLRRGRDISARALISVIIMLATAFLFLFVIDTGILNAICLRFGIDTKGRLSFWNYAMQYCDVSLDYFGMGYTYFARLFGELYESGFRLNGYGVAASIHSDVLRMYIELGIFMFSLWILYDFYIKTLYLKKRSKYIVAESYLLLSIYMYVLYLTDNVMNYYLVQSVYFLVPLVLEHNHSSDRIHTKINTALR